MSAERRRVVLKTAATGLASVLIPGCTSTDTGQSDPDHTDESERDSTSTTLTQSVSDDYGPWGVVVVNNLEKESTVTVRLLTPDGDVHDETEVTVAGGDGTEALTVDESGTYTLEASTAFDSATVEFDACKLNSEAVVELATDGDERRLSINQRHSDPAAGTTIDDPYTCE